MFLQLTRQQTVAAGPLLLLFVAAAAAAAAVAPHMNKTEARDLKTIKGTDAKRRAVSFSLHVEISLSQARPRGPLLLLLLEYQETPSMQSLESSSSKSNFVAAVFKI